MNEIVYGTDPAEFGWAIAWLIATITLLLPLFWSFAIMLTHRLFFQKKK